jgi:CelD/BcsL family acetyltransferase involved in cellulose biosynthesis
MNREPRRAEQTTTDATPGLDVEIVRGVQAMAGLREDWIALDGVSGEPDFFQSFAWSMQVAEVRARDGTGRWEALAAVGRRGEKIVALWPLARERRAGQHELRNLDDPFGQLAGVLAREEADGTALVAAALKLARDQRLASVASFERVIEGSALSRALLAAGGRPRGAVEAPFVALRVHSSFAQLKATRNKKSMKNLRNAFNRLERAGRVESLYERAPDRTAAIGRQALANRERWLADTARTAPAFRVAGFGEILLGESRWGLAEKRAALELKLDDASIAQQLGFVHDDRYYAYISGMDWTKEALAPGRIHLALVLEAMHVAGLAGAELLTPASDYKMVWTDSTHRLTDVALPLTARGRVKLALWDDRMRPALKAAYYAMPDQIRRRLAGMAHAGAAAEPSPKTGSEKPAVR